MSRLLLGFALASVACLGAEPAKSVDCSLAVPDRSIGSVLIDVCEVSVEADVSQRVCRVDCADPTSYAPDRGKAAYRVKSEGPVNFLRLGENRQWGYGFGVRSREPVPVSAGGVYDIGFLERVASNDCTSVLYVKALDAHGDEVTPSLTVPRDWTYSPFSKAWWIAPISLAATNVWTSVKRRIVVPDGAAFLVPIVAGYRGSGVDFRELEVTRIRVQRRKRLAFSRRMESPDGGVTLIDDEAQIQVNASCARDDAGAFIVKATVTDVARPSRPRALQVSLGWNHDLPGWQWHRHWREDLPIGRDSRYRYEYTQTDMPVGRYPFSAVSKGGMGVILGTEFDGPKFESRTVCAQGVTSTIRLGLLERNGRGMSAEVGWIVMPFRGTWGFRSAAKAYYASQARKLPVPPCGAKEGAWNWPVQPTALPENPDDFGLTFWEAPEWAAQSPQERRRAREMGLGVYPYSEVGGMRQALKGKDERDLPSVEERLAELRRWAGESGTKDIWFSAPRDIAAKACLNSLPVSPDGSHPFVLDKWDSWTHWWMTNADPRLAKPNRCSLCWDYTVGRYLDDVEGVYLDSLGTAMSGFNNVREDHLAVMTEPLVYDEATARPCANGMQHLTAYVKWVASELHPKGKRLFGNAFNVSYRFHATTVDIMGREVGSFGHANVRDVRLRNALPDEDACMQRFYCYRRPVVNLLQEGNFTTPLPAIPPEGITNYVNEHVFYAFYPGVCTVGGEDKPGYAGWRRYFDGARQCERDRLVFRRAIPMIRRLNRAGWEPETLVRSDRVTILVERYGSLPGDCLLTLRNASDEATDVKLTPEGRFKGCRLVPVWRGNAQARNDAETSSGAGPWRLHLAAWETAVCEIRDASCAGFADCLERFEKLMTVTLAKSARTMDDGTRVYNPDAGKQYNATWLRDFTYMAESGLVPTNDVVNEAMIFLNGVSKDFEGVDCVRHNGVPVYRPGGDRMGDKPVADGGPFTVSVAYLAWKQSGDVRFIDSPMLQKLLRVFAAIPRAPDGSGLVWIDPAKTYDRCPYGFTDTVRKQGAVLFTSLLKIEAGRRLEEMLVAAGRMAEAAGVRDEVALTERSVNRVFWNEASGLYRAATVKCREDDVWGSAFAVWLKVAPESRVNRIVRRLTVDYSRLVHCGQVRHLLPGVYWEDCRMADGSPVPHDVYQNGAFWGTATGWMCWAIAHADPSLALKTFQDLAADYESNGACECHFAAPGACPWKDPRPCAGGYPANLGLTVRALQRFLNVEK